MRKKFVMRPFFTIFADKTATKMYRGLLLLINLLIVATAAAQRTILVKKGDAKSLLDAIAQSNTMNEKEDAERTFILIPNGYYDLGETVLTRISGNNVALVGESMEGTIIRNAPDKKIESISKTAVLQNRGKGNYFQDLTLKNDLDYYNAGDDGRAVTLQDKGTRTICNRVRLLSYQDTYYSDNEKCQHYFHDCEIHGTIDFICGAGDVWFERCRIVAERRHPDGSGHDIIVAVRTSDTRWGYIFNNCTIDNDLSAYYYGRSWHTRPRCVLLHTTLTSPEKLLTERFDPEGMKISSNYFKEYGTKDAYGKDITPESNVVRFTLRDHTQPFIAETIMSKDEARQYKIGRIFSNWKPGKELTQWERKSKKMWKHNK